MLSTFYTRCKCLIVLCMLLLAIQVINAGGNYFLVSFGIMPRQLDSLWHIFTAPFIHGSYSHLLNNLLGLSIFSGLCLLRSIRFYVYSSIFIILFSGILVWCFARPAYHVGASGWVFGLWALVIARAYFDANIKNLLLSLFVIVFYGGMIYGVLPAERAVSFESHLAGVFAGIACAFYTSRFDKKRLS